MIVWGGQNPAALNSGGRYVPSTDTWTATNVLSAPSARYRHTAVWTGSEMIVWGGGTVTAVNTGGRYDPVTNTWAPTSVLGAPSARNRHTAVWTGDRMLVWGGVAASITNTGSRYDPTTDSWVPTSLVGAPAPRARHSMVWTGAEAIVWGGTPQNDYQEIYDTGGRYDPALDTWAPTYSSGTPQAREWHTAVWTGTEMIIWGGEFTNAGDGSPLPSPTGGRYDPALDAWTPTALAGVPQERTRHTAVWTGDRMVVWGGSYFNGYLNTGGRYDPLSDSWSATSLTGAPTGRERHRAVWTGSEMIVWGGRGSSPAFDTGGRYDPVGNTWTPTSTFGAPSSRLDHSQIWTGSQMIVWGGQSTKSGPPLATGAVYTPDNDGWTATSDVGAPDARTDHDVVWTGSEMLVWGGGWIAAGVPGGRYDPVSDAWLSMSTVGAPANTPGPIGVWTGRRMIVWGTLGLFPARHQYDPASDSWTPMSTIGEPFPRERHTALWTGDAMLVWGGYGGTYLASGGIYDADGQDLDGDGVGCVFDCNEAQAGAFAAPGEVPDTRFHADKVTLEWPSQKPAFGSATAYDVARGSITELPVGGGAAESCAANGYDPVPVAGLVQLADATPDPGGGLWYLVRATNACGIGTYGSASAGPERITAVCP
jgi:hypothetical protein